MQYSGTSSLSDFYQSPLKQRGGEEVHLDKGVWDWRWWRTENCDWDLEGDHWDRPCKAIWSSLVRLTQVRQGNWELLGEIGMGNQVKSWDPVD